MRQYSLNQQFSIGRDVAFFALFGTLVRVFPMFLIIVCGFLFF